MILPRRPLPQATGSDKAGEDRKCPPSGKGDRVGVVAPHGGRGTKDGGRGFGGGRLGCGFRQPNSETEFGGSVIGIGPLRPAGGRGTARRVVVPYGWLRRAAAIALASGAQRSVCASGCKGWVGIGAEVTPKGASNAGQSLSQPAADSSLCTKGALGDGSITGDTQQTGRCGHRPLRRRGAARRGVVPYGGGERSFLGKL